jgi:Lamin Tail Domain/Secretion system C-terminal sorting domain
MKKRLLFFAAIIIAQLSMAQCNELFISEYVEGTLNNKAIEIYNPTADTIDLTPYTIRRYKDGFGILTEEQNLYGSIAPYDVFIIVNGNATPPADSALQALADCLTVPWGYPTPLDMDGNDAIVLYNMNTLSFVDVFGHTNDPNMQTVDGWGFLGGNRYWTKDHTLIRKHAVMQGVTVNPSTTFDPSLEWDSLPADVWENLGYHNCKCHVSIEENPTNLLHFTIFPNPNKNDFVYIKANHKIKRIEVINMLGECIQFVDIQKQTSNYTVHFNQAMPKAVYFIKVLTMDNKYMTEKLIIR